MANKRQTSLADELVMTKIHCIRSQKVILDKDLAQMYGVDPRRLREQVKRNQKRFPEHFMFQLTENELVECRKLRHPGNFGGHLPYAFTEHGVLMAANVLKSERAVQVSLRLIEIFVKMREMLSAHKDILLRLEQLERKITGHDVDIQMIFSTLKRLLTQSREPRPRIGYRRKDEKD